MEIKAHKFVLHFGAVPVLAKLMDRQNWPASLNTANQSIRVELNFGAFSQDVVRFFFGLCYHNELAAAFAEPHGVLRQTLEENVLELHQLACYFGFSALQTLCQARAYRLFSLETINDLSNYCLQPLSEAQGGHYYVPQEKHALYTKLMHWYQLCVDDAAGPARSTGNKTIVMSQKRRHVENFAQFQLPDAGAQHQGDATTRLTHYRRVCTECIQRPRLIHRERNAVINMGACDDQWLFSMTHKLGDNTNMMLFLKYRYGGGATSTSSSQSDDDHMSVECSSGATRIYSRVRLFNKAGGDEDCSDVTEDEMETDGALSELTRVCCLALHPDEDCYEAVCDCCRRAQDAVFIFCITVTIIK
jgi:hypothetical protein